MTSSIAKFTRDTVWSDYAGATVSIVRQRLAGAFRNIVAKIVLRDQVLEWNATVEVDDVEILKRWTSTEQVTTILSEVEQGGFSFLGSVQLMHIKEGLTPRSPYSWSEEPANPSPLRGVWPSRAFYGTGSRVDQVLGGYSESEAIRRQLGARTGGSLATWDDVADFLEIRRGFTTGVCVFEVRVPIYARVDLFDPPRTFRVAASAAIASDRVSLLIGRAAATIEQTLDRQDEHGSRRELTFSASEGEIITGRTRFQVILDGSAVHEGTLDDVVDLAAAPTPDALHEIQPIGFVDSDLFATIAAPVPPSPTPMWTLDVSFVHDTSVRTVLERNVRELGVAAREELHTAALVLAGAIGEGVLYDALVRRKSRSMGAPSAPRHSKQQGGAVKDIEKDKWDLAHYIRVAEEIGVLGSNAAKMADGVLRGFRNMIHPKLQAETGCVPDQAEMRGSQAWLEALVRDVRKAP